MGGNSTSKVADISSFAAVVLFDASQRGNNGASDDIIAGNDGLG